MLVVEDEYLMADGLARALRRMGADILGPVATLGDALDLITGAPGAEASGADLAILDVHLGENNVFPLVDAFLARGVPFVPATGYDPASMPERYRDVPCWQKPYDPTILTEAPAGRGE